ncbi:glycosyltransferase family 2 protein [Paenibacillus sp. SZ31]|uniref:glycosyltransferase family 2 protein n=1 Tax=Paenibacillus sp. SZ31 TaxID=2725555 RepID=UPI00146DAEB4|nr:glycosyltransferase family A protein [Paenibacillus sp. SZ31]NMI06929.1 glycosyltransferase family 2 protein [Paenibacillus sp. SZ31]
MQPKVSMVISCFNKVNYISDMLDSVLTQKWDNIEIILINDGSNDGTRTVIGKYEGKLRDRGYEVVIVDQENQGVAAVVRNGLKLVTGEFVCIPDCDDLLHEEYVSAMVNVLEQFPDVNCVVCDEIRNRWDVGFAPVVNISTTTLVSNYNQNLLASYIMRKISTSVAVLMFRSILIHELGLIKNFITHLSQTQEDQIWIPILSSEKSIIHLHRPLYSYILRANSIVTSQIDIEQISKYAETRSLLSQNTLKNCMDSMNKLELHLFLLTLCKYSFVIRRISRNQQLENYKEYYVHKFVEAVNETDFLPCKLDEYVDRKIGFSVAFNAVSNYLTQYSPEKKNTLPTVRDTKGRLIAYGAGFVAKSALEDFVKCNVVPNEIWDIKAQQGDHLFEIPLMPPDFDSLKIEDTVIIFLYGNQNVEYELRKTNSNIFYFQDVLNDLSAECFAELVVKQEE